LFFLLLKASGRGCAALSAVPADTFFALFFLLLKVSGRGYAALSAAPADTFFYLQNCGKAPFCGRTTEQKREKFRRVIPRTEERLFLNIKKISLERLTNAARFMI